MQQKYIIQHSITSKKRIRELYRPCALALQALQVDAIDGAVFFLYVPDEVLLVELFAGDPLYQLFCTIALAMPVHVLPQPF